MVDDLREGGADRAVVGFEGVGGGGAGCGEGGEFVVDVSAEGAGEPRVGGGDRLDGVRCPAVDGKAAFAVGCWFEQGASVLGFREDGLTHRVESRGDRARCRANRVEIGAGLAQLRIHERDGFRAGRTRPRGGQGVRYRPVGCEAGVGVRKRLVHFVSSSVEFGKAHAALLVVACVELRQFGT
ncbi:hypothetical protein [Nocardia tengchongensis]|uniref:hypothetical protein n=1 Tax=Nocardia tengchongensis TaxID=2055889 RepID=UPI00366751E8